MNRIFKVLSFLFLASCSNELDLLDDYKETTVVYGLLNQSDTTQYIKIYKAYLGEGNALHMAQNYDSINYANQLNVEIERWLGGAKLETYTLQKDNSIAKDPGIFVAPDQILYKTNTLLDENSEYRLVVTNTSTGNTVESRTALVKSPFVSSPSNGPQLVIFNPNANQTIEWLSSKNGLLYQVIIRFHYDEKNIATQVTTPKYIDWVFPAQKSINTAGGELMKIKFPNSDFYKKIKAIIPVDEGVQRFARNKKIEYFFSVAAEDYSTYMDVYKPSNTIVQEKPEYTNIEGGLGLFSSRINLTIVKDSLSKQSVDSLIAGQYTSDLGFQ